MQKNDFMSIKAVIFDWGNVYLNWKDEFWKNLAKKLGIPTLSLERAVQKYWDLVMKAEINDVELWRRIGEEVKLKLPKESERWIEERAEKDFFVNKDVELVARNLQKHGCKTALLSNTEKSTLKYGNEHGWTKYFDFVVASCDCGIIKPDLEIFKMTLEKLDEKPEDCIFIDDKKIFLDVAESLRMNIILFDNRKQDFDYLKRKLIKLGVKKEVFA